MSILLMLSNGRALVRMIISPTATNDLSIYNDGAGTIVEVGGDRRLRSVVQIIYAQRSSALPEQQALGLCKSSQDPQSRLKRDFR